MKRVYPGGAPAVVREEGALPSATPQPCSSSLNCLGLGRGCTTLPSSRTCKKEGFHHTPTPTRRQSFSVYPQSWISLYSSGRSQTQRSTFLCLPSDGIKGVATTPGLKEGLLRKYRCPRREGAHTSGILQSIVAGRCWPEEGEN